MPVLKQPTSLQSVLRWERRVLNKRLLWGRNHPNMPKMSR